MEKEKECKWKYKVESKSCAAIKVRGKQSCAAIKVRNQKKNSRLKYSLSWTLKKG